MVKSEVKDFNFTLFNTVFIKHLNLGHLFFVTKL